MKVAKLVLGILCIVLSLFVLFQSCAAGGKGGSIACLIIFLLAFIIGKSLAGSYTDLNIWAFFCLIIAVINLIALLRKKTE